MYSDELASNGTERRSVKERIGGAKAGATLGVTRTIVKRSKIRDDKWQHDLFENGEGSGSARNGRKGRLPAGDLRHKLLTAGGQVEQTEPRGSGLRVVMKSGGGKSVMDLRHKLSGTTPARKVAIARTTSHEVPAESHRRIASVVSNPGVAAPGVNSPSEQVGSLSLATFLRRLGLEKYLSTLQAEEVDVPALRQLSDEDLKELGIPMGPRKKLLQAAKVH